MSETKIITLTGSAWWNCLLMLLFGIPSNYRLIKFAFTLEPRWKSEAAIRKAAKKSI